MNEVALAPAARAAADAGAPYLEIRGLTKSYGAFQALMSIDLDVPARAFVCFLGPSGCGKSTLLRAIAGLDVQTSGTIRQAGRDVSRLPPAERDFGIVFQSYALFPNLTVIDNVGYGLVNRRLPKAQRQSTVASLLELVGLAEFGAKCPAQLSGGQQQRVALARALAVEPGLLLLDEPLSALDARVRLRLRDEIVALQRRLGITTIMVTHDQEEALTMADLVVIMNHGKIEQVGTPEDVYNRPASRFVADFVGTMSAFSGTLIAPDRVRAGAIEFSCPRQSALAVGAAVAVRIRPEAMRLVDAPGPGVVPGTLTQRVFHGSLLRLSVRAPGEHAGKQRAVVVARAHDDVARRDVARRADVAGVQAPHAAPVRSRVAPRRRGDERSRAGALSRLSRLREPAGAGRRPGAPGRGRARRRHPPDRGAERRRLAGGRRLAPLRPDGRRFRARCGRRGDSRAGAPGARSGAQPRVERWVGVYGSGPADALIERVDDAIAVVAVTSGTGASTAFGLARDCLEMLGIG